MLLSACLIVKNEEKFLPKCLSSLVDIVDEIIIVDTGSNDRTIDIAKEYTDYIFDYKWDNNFANARNESLKKANGKYRLIIDADEYLDEKDKWDLRPFLESNEISGGFLTVNNYSGDAGKRVGITPVMLMRIIRNDFYYTEAIHEQIDPLIFVNENPVVKIPTTIHHLGYLNQIVSERQKSERNIQLLKDLLEKNPNDTFQRINLAAEYMILKEYDKVLELCKNNYEDFDIINSLLNGTAEPYRIHLVARNYKFYISSLVNLNKFDEAIAIAKEAHSIIPMVSDYMYLMALAYLRQNKVNEAIEWFTLALKQGDMKTSLYDHIVGSGSFLAHLELGKIWTMLGDDHLALQHYFQAFIIQPMISHVIVFYLLYLLPVDESFLTNQIENKIIDLQTLHTYAEAYANLNRPHALEVIERAEQKYGVSSLTIRAKGTLILSENPSQFPNYIAQLDNKQNELLMRRWLGIYYLNIEDFNAAEAYLQGSDDEGRRIWDTAGVLIKQGLPIIVNIEPHIRDLVATHSENLLRKWLPYARDIETTWSFIKYSPYQYLLEEIYWPGDTVHQCEQNAIREFKAKNYDLANQWLIKALAFSSTVTKILIESDLALIKNDRQYAVRILAYGKIVFEESIVINSALTQLVGYADAIDILKSMSKLHRLEDLLMNPLDAYQKNMVNTMPLNIQLAQLHLRGAALTRQAKVEAENSNITNVRARIQDIQEIITFLRTSLDPKLEISVQTDEIYLFYYKMLVRWFLNPKEIPEEFDAFIEFWESWTKTWAKAQVK